jgi:hypothetical protein
VLNEIVFSPEAFTMSFASDNRTCESWRNVDFSAVTSQVSCVAEIFGFAARDGTFVWSSVFVHVFPVDS